MSKFAITKELINSYYQAGLTVPEMAKAITAASGFPCSDGTVRKACAAYGLNLRKKPLKSPFTFGDSVETTTSNSQTVAENRSEGELSDGQGVRF